MFKLSILQWFGYISMKMPKSKDKPMLLYNDTQIFKQLASCELGLTFGPVVNIMEVEKGTALRNVKKGERWLTFKVRTWCQISLVYFYNTTALQSLYRYALNFTHVIYLTLIVTDVGYISNLLSVYVLLVCDLFIYSSM